MKKSAGKSGAIRAGIGGWDYEPWRKTFYPAGLPQKRALEYASRQLSAIEVNGTFYRTQQPSTFKRWHDETPDGFVFALKAVRYAVNRRVLAEAGPSIKLFIDSGIAELGAKLGPILWQLAPTKKYDADDIARFLDLLPEKAGGVPLRHVLEARHESFLVPEFIGQVRGRGIATVYTDSAEYPSFADVSAGFVYARLMCAQASLKTGYAPKDLKAWAQRAQTWAQGGWPADLHCVVQKAPVKTPRDVFVFFINGAKERAPAAALGLIAALQ
ncbi:MAG TPA: DUF72 domain-containing protein [Nevskiaceae bacterium]|nr:DUF72 domain-containing protein [Nevskiaceae bacterium]